MSAALITALQKSRDEERRVLNQLFDEGDTKMKEGLSQCLTDLEQKFQAQIDSSVTATRDSLLVDCQMRCGNLAAKRNEREQQDALQVAGVKKILVDIHSKVDNIQEVTLTVVIIDY
jgi:hypothetical protein